MITQKHSEDPLDDGDMITQKCQGGQHPALILFLWFKYNPKQLLRCQERLGTNPQTWTLFGCTEKETMDVWKPMVL